METDVDVAPGLVVRHGRGRECLGRGAVLRLFGFARARRKKLAPSKRALIPATS